MKEIMDIYLMKNFWVLCAQPYRLRKIITHRQKKLLFSLTLWDLFEISFLRALINLVWRSCVSSPAHPRKAPHSHSIPPNLST